MLSLVGTKRQPEETTAEDTLGATEEAGLRKIIYEDTSPDQSRMIIVYEMEYDPRFYHGYYEDYFNNKKTIVSKDTKSGREYVIFTGEERIGRPQWLGNNHVFFTTHCGTACKGLYLVDVRNKETRFAVWGYTFSKEKNIWETHFTDWFGHDHTFDGIVDALIPQIIDADVYLIFKMKGEDGSPMPNKQFLFAGEGLKEVILN
jgi:hypothetical protein